jgi:hypothetical protein
MDRVNLFEMLRACVECAVHQNMRTREEITKLLVSREDNDTFLNLASTGLNSVS